MKNKVPVIVTCISIIVIIISLFFIFTSDTTETTPTQTPAPVQTATPTPEPTPTPIPRRGSAEPIPESVKVTMQGKSMKDGASITYDDLSYLTIPHYDFNGNIVTGHLVVSAALAEEVLDIFAELLDVGYPIERMELIDKYDADDFTSIEYNNTSAFNYRQVSTGTGKLSLHAYGRAIDINPQTNPYVYRNGTGAHENAREFWSRDISKWTREIDKKAYIGNDTEIYRIFKKYGWTWGGDWSSAKDYQHFEK